jgi:hypothetical protein
VIDHVLTMPLSLEARVGFSILNLTGYPIRYLQVWENGNVRTLQYLDSGKRGLLNFIASKTLMCDNEIIEVQFDVQGQQHRHTRPPGGGGGTNTSAVSKKSTTRLGHHVSFQVAGYKWLKNIQADTLGIKFEDIHPVLGLLDLRKAYPNNLEVQHTVKLVTEVHQQNGGRVLQLNSVFMVKNLTSHALQLLAHENSNLNIAQEDDPFILPVGESFYVPLALLYRSIVKSQANSLGYLWLKPLTSQPIVDELGISSHLVGEVSYTVDPINLMQTVRTTLNAIARNDISNLPHLTSQQLSCKLAGSVDHKEQQQRRQPRISKYGSTRHLLNRRDDCLQEQRERVSGGGGDDSHSSSRKFSSPVTRVFNYDTLPAFCYNIEVESLSSSSSPAGNLNETMSDTDGSGSRGIPPHDRSPKNSQQLQPRIYSIGRVDLRLSFPSSLSPSLPLLCAPVVIHPPIVLENLLPVSGTFELVNEKDSSKTVLWSAVIEPGKSKPVHSVAMDASLLLLINLDFCRSSEGTLIHAPDDLLNNSVTSLPGTIYKGLKGFIEENFFTKTQSSIILTDSVGQRLRLHIQNKMGGGGHRHILVYCPYWVINTSQYSLRLKEEGSQYLPAGTVTAQR